MHACRLGGSPNCTAVRRCPRGSFALAILSILDRRHACVPPTAVLCATWSTRAGVPSWRVKLLSGLPCALPASTSRLPSQILPNLYTSGTLASRLLRPCAPPDKNMQAPQVGGSTCSAVGTLRSSDFFSPFHSASAARCTLQDESLPIAALCAAWQGWAHARPRSKPLRSTNRVTLRHALLLACLLACAPICSPCGSGIMHSNCPRRHVKPAGRAEAARASRSEVLD